MKRFLKWFFSILDLPILGFSGFAAFQIYRVYYGKHVYKTVPPVLPAVLLKPALLVFSKTNGFREDDPIRASNEALAAIVERRVRRAFFTENGAVFNPATLSRFDATVWNNTSGDLLSAAQKAAFQSYIESGGGFVGIHGSGGDPRFAWRWYVDTPIGAQFKGHPLGPQFQRATIHIEIPGDPAMKNLGANWSRVDEWYSVEGSPRSQKAFEVLATLDESTYSPKMLWKDIRMGADHPIIWKHCVGQGRVFYSALGHAASTYREPLHLAELKGGIAWAAGLEGTECSQ